MKLYDFAAAPNPRRVRMFLAEKGIAVETVQVDLRRGAHFLEAYRAINPRCLVPTLMLEDGTSIAEVAAIWRYFEASHPDPALLGRSPKQQALIAMWESWVELDGLAAVAEALRNGSRGFVGRAVPGPHDHAQIPELAARGRARVEEFYADLDARLASAPFVAGDDFSAADITAIVTIDFASGWIKLPPPSSLEALARWCAAIRARPSASA